MADDSGKKTRFLAVKVSPTQYEALQQRADHSGMRLATWMRSIVLQAANQKPRKGHLRIREPNETS
jgi:hypothetical protein